MQVVPLLFGIPLGRVSAMTGDEIEYWELSRGSLFSFTRPPGYPVVVSLISWTNSTVLLSILQSVLLATRPLVVRHLLSKYLGMSQRAAFLAGLLCALSMTGAMIGKRVLADGIFSMLWLVAIWLLLASFHHENRGLAILSGLAAAAALALKPVGVLWFPASIAIQLLFPSRSFWAAAVRFAASILPAFVWFSLFVWVMWVSFGSAVYSGIGTVTMARYLIPASESLRVNGGVWKDSQVRRFQDMIFSWDAWQEVQTPEGFRGISGRVREHLTAHPWNALHAALHAGGQNFPRPFSNSRTGVLGDLLNCVVWLLAVIGCIRMHLHVRFRQVAFLLFMIGSFAVTTSISFWEGSRLMFPSEWALFALAGYVFDSGSAAGGAGGR
ncbi:MAG: hypothetical protein ACKO2P_00770 [Planctomycetota bacterium]